MTTPKPTALEREITTPEELHETCDGLRDVCRRLHDALSLTVDEFQPALVLGLVEKGYTTIEARTIARRVCQPLRHAVGLLSEAAISGQSCWRAYQRLVAQPVRRRKRNGRVFHVSEPAKR